MDPVSIMPAIVSLFIAIATTYILVKKFGAPLGQGKYASIDGLRGFLAFFVFLHHSSIWYFYLRTDLWNLPPSNFYTHLGQSSVSLFFMITGFLFFSKLIDARSMGIDWTRLFVSRFFRLVPLYLFAIIIVFIIVAFLSDGILNEPIIILIKHAAYWIGFTVLGDPDLNRINQTFIIVAGVTWSLPYEWFFYFTLPLLALLVRVVPPLPCIILGVISLVTLIFWRPHIGHLLPFLSGIIASLLVRYSIFCNLASRKICSYFIIGFIVIIFYFFPSKSGFIQFSLLSLIFLLVAGGNNIFGVLIHPISRSLGEFAYSIYLLHGICLFVVFNFIFGIENSKLFSSMYYWIIIVLLSPIIIIVSFVSFRCIERPAMKSTDIFLNWCRSILKNA